MINRAARPALSARHRFGVRGVEDRPPGHVLGRGLSRELAPTKPDTAARIRGGMPDPRRWPVHESRFCAIACLSN